MKKFSLILVVCICFVNISFAADTMTTFKWAYGENILTLGSGMLATSHLTREEIAPILVKYIAKVAKKDYADRNCSARDIETSSSIYKEDLKKLCGYGIMRGDHGMLYPKRALTNAQAIALVMRVVDGFQNNGKPGQHWALNYFERAKALGFQGILPIYYTKNGLMTLESFINFLYSVEHPHETIEVLDYKRDRDNYPTHSRFKSSDDALLKLAEILNS